MPAAHELALIEALARRLPPAGSRVIAGPGDDAAVVAGRPVCVTSVDGVVDDVHFRLGAGAYTHSDVGFKALGSALSDLAAMGVCAGEAYLTLCAPPGLCEADALAIVDGACELAAQTQTSIAGGDIVGGATLGVFTTVVGWADSPSIPVYRSGAAPGDLVGVTGTLGGAGAGLALMQGRATLTGDAAARALARARRPRPRLAEGAALGGAGARAMIDISDGLATDAAHLGRAGGLTLEIDLSLLPIDHETVATARQLGIEPWRLAACAGEDYELCVCVAPAQRPAAERALAQAGGASITWVGEAVESGGSAAAGARFTLEGSTVPLEGFEHRW